MKFAESESNIPHTKNVWVFFILIALHEFGGVLWKLVFDIYFPWLFKTLKANVFGEHEVVSLKELVWNRELHCKIKTANKCMAVEQLAVRNESEAANTVIEIICYTCEFWFSVPIHNFFGYGWRFTLKFGEACFALWNAFDMDFAHFEWIQALFACDKNGFSMFTLFSNKAIDLKYFLIFIQISWRVGRFECYCILNSKLFRGIKIKVLLKYLIYI